MVNWTHLKTLVSENPLQSLQRRSPDFYELYAGKTDDYGFKLETWAKWEPVFRFFFEDYFKVEVRGIENIPEKGKAIIIGNHSGLIPIDAGMMSMVMCHSHRNPRRVRYLITDWFLTLPFLGDWMKETGQVRASLETAEKLLADGEIIGLYPEGVRGVGKSFRDRYRVLDFHPGFVKLAIASQTPIIPVATIGGDEIFPNLTNLTSIARIMRLPFFPVTPAFPWLPFPLWITPLPIRWFINIRKPIYLNYPPEKANDKKLVRDIAKDIQYEIQRDLNDLLEKRHTLFTGGSNG